MKTSWTIEYLNKNYPGQRLAEWRAAKRKELQNRTGVAWVDWTASGKIQFHPNWTKDTPELEYPNTAKSILEVIEDEKFGMTFLAITKRLPHLPLAMIIGVSKKLARTGMVVPVQGRCGSAYGIRKFK